MSSERWTKFALATQVSLVMKTTQVETWTGQFGRDYTDRNVLDVDALDALYAANYGVTRTSLNEEFLSDVGPKARILEVGCNMGNQLLLLEKMGFQNLYGIEIQPYALEKATSRIQNATLQVASAFEIPYPDEHFDMVFTSGVLIHIAPEDLGLAIKEIHRVTRKYIWGLEYFAPRATEISYFGHNQLLWKMDYAKSYLDQFEDLKLTKARLLRYLKNDNVDQMFLLQKGV
jgi:pseudaminic acid biosynthesis-associated methylase